MLFLTGICGAGKSTIFRLIMGLETPGKGRLLYNGYNVHRLSQDKHPKHLRSIGVVFQDDRLLLRKTAKENIIVPLHIQGVSGTQADKKIDAVASQIGIGHLLNRRVKSLSGGERQLVAIARAAIHKPLLILADEPTANLDRTVAFGIFDILKRINANGVAVVIATHDIDMVKSHAIRTILIKESGLLEVR